MSRVCTRFTLITQIHFDQIHFDLSDEHLLIMKVMITKSTCFKDLLIMKIITMSTKVDLLQTILVPDQQGVLRHSCLNLQHFLRCLKCLTFGKCSWNVLLPGETWAGQGQVNEQVAPEMFVIFWFDWATVCNIDIILAKIDIIFTVGNS